MNQISYSFDSCQLAVFLTTPFFACLLEGIVLEGGPFFLLICSSIHINMTSWIFVSSSGLLSVTLIYINTQIFPAFGRSRLLKLAPVSFWHYPSLWPFPYFWHNKIFLVYLVLECAFLWWAPVPFSRNFRSQILYPGCAHCHWDVIASRLSLWVEIVFSHLPLPYFQLQTLTIRALAPTILNVFTYLLNFLYETTLSAMLTKSCLFLHTQSYLLNFL